MLEGGQLVQAGTPEEIYTEPATPFVARFTGLAGELRVRVRERGANGTALVEPDAGRASRARVPAGTVPGDRALVMIRPTGVQRIGCVEAKVRGRLPRPHVDQRYGSRLVTG